MKKQERERVWADGESVKWRGKHMILSQRTPLSGAPAGNMCGNTRMDSNSSCLWEGRVCLIHCFCVVPDFPTLSRDLNHFFFIFYLRTLKCSMLHQKERHSIWSAQNISRYTFFRKLTCSYNPRLAQHSCILNRSVAILLTSNECLHLIVTNC